MNTNIKIYCVAVLAVVSIAVSVPVYAETKTKQVCKDVVGKDGKVVKNKDGTAKQACKTIKVHKKLEGTPVPDKKK
jgi:membrane protein implicated in regulation of membrane protease activity